MNYETYYIPANFTDAGRVLGLFAPRNLVETLIVTLPALYLCIMFLPLALTPKIIVTLAIIVPLGGFALVGISDDSLSRWLSAWWHWRRSRRLILFRGEVKR
ncbi:hypothetical protein H8790_11615 [Oscillibacter hominis]|uniref:PrgI family protein n=1 Tax=Oscillibacter hominis TaxID=2763056 RepID=A0A7G9B3E7_9FIRM|nr:PrgI family protein [Oscillibacter hominis]QNL44078.1 hypothetical protein H8790_11615 [Oscillibacter hominis]